MKHLKSSTRLLLNKAIYTYTKGLELKSLFITIKNFIIKTIKVNQELLNNINKIMNATK